MLSGPHHVGAFEYMQWQQNPQGRIDIVFLHGFGADMHDLVPLAQYLQVPNLRRAYFFNGVIPAGGLPSGRAWFQIDVQALEAAMMRGEYRDFNRPVPEAVIRLAQDLEKALLEDLGLQSENVVLAGFSQGAMLAMSCLLNSSNRYAGLVQMSGTFLDREHWTQQLRKLARSRFFISHGHTDALLNPQDAEDLYQVLSASGHQVHKSFFAGGHEIPISVLQDLSRFLNLL